MVNRAGHAGRVSALVGAACVACVACNPAPIDETDNQFPAHVLGWPEDTTSTPEPTADVVADPDSDVTVPQNTLEGTYRIDCIKIEQLGSVGAAAFQTQFLGIAWTADIRDFKLNIMVDVHALDAEAGTATLQIRSGVGADELTMCGESTTTSPQTDGVFDSGTALIRPTTDAERLDDGFCADDASAKIEAAEGTATFQFATDELVWIYAEDNDKTPFNCTADAAEPDAVPLHAVSADIVFGPDGTWAAGRLHGCLNLAEAEVLCSCIGSCQGPPGEGPCVGCPDGSKPLASQLAGVTTSDECTDIMGEPSFDLTASFSALQLGYVPEVCE